ncbi:DUF3566 domain-containing protein [Sanguibacter massiliensis]|uniref:DUF3566 domain-containing protein n=1 Tax=Sanguibacter massiliensis TaxID=1973217 RepID=UPI001A927D20|nr:DUF3566 domain-containing protein [Sanguibacter massiliensis]
MTEKQDAAPPAITPKTPAPRPDAPAGSGPVPAPTSAPRPVDEHDDEHLDEEDYAPRKVRLTLSRIDPWSVMKMAFLLSIAIGIMIVVAAFVFWYALNDLGVFTSIDETIRKIVGTESELDILQYVERDRVVSLAMIIAVVDVVLMTALSTIGAFLYNVVAALVGGVHMTLTDD